MAEKVWIPSIDREGTLRVQRMDYLKICGTISKHGFTRLGDVVRKIRAILAANGTEVDVGQCYLVIPESQEWFRDNIFIASSSLVAWHLNEILWGIFTYLITEFLRSFTPTEVITEAQMYRYDVPSSITDPLVRSMYWDLMNGMRSQPYFRRFTISPYQRDLYSACNTIDTPHSVGVDGRCAHGGLHSLRWFSACRRRLAKA